MPYLRLSLMKPLPGQEAEVKEINQQLVHLYRSLEGCLAAFAVAAVDGSGDLGRLTVWESEHAADHAATHHHSLALRSQLHLLIQPGHQERSFIAE